MRPSGPSVWIVGVVGLHSERFRSVTLSAEELRGLYVHDGSATYRGDGKLLVRRLQAQSLGIAALCPAASEEKRLLDAMLLAVLR